MPNLPEAFIADRDQKMFELRKRGANYREIARAFKVSPSTAHAGVHRVLAQISKAMAHEHRDVIFMELERLDDLIKALSPMTRAQRMTIDGQDIEIPPNLDAIKETRALIAQRAKMMGLETQVIETRTTTLDATPPAITSETQTPDTPEQLARDMAMEMIESGVVSGQEAELLRTMLQQHVEDPDVVDAELVEPAGPVAELEAGPAALEPPEWIDFDDEPMPWDPGDERPGLDGRI